MLNFANIIKTSGFALSCCKKAPPRLRLATVVAVATFGVAVTPPANALVISSFVDATFTGFGTGATPYDTATISVAVNPALTNWIAWNIAPTVSAFSGQFPGQGPFLYGGGFGTDDFITMQVSGPGGSLTVTMDQNTSLGVSFGPQQVIFGTAAAAPDVVRINPPFASPPSVHFLFNEGGTHNSIFTTADLYTFTFRFFDNGFGTSSAGHFDIYLLRDVNPALDAVPLPGALPLFATGLGVIGLLGWRRKRKAATANLAA